MYLKRISVRNYRNFGDQPFVLLLKPFTLLLGENNVGKTNLLNAIALLFSQEIGVVRRSILDVEDFNYGSLTAFRKQVADGEKDAAEVVFPEVIIDAVLSDFEPDQEAVVGDWFVDSALDTAQVTYRFAFMLHSALKSESSGSTNNVSCSKQWPQMRGAKQVPRPPKHGDKWICRYATIGTRSTGEGIRVMSVRHISWVNCEPKFSTP